MPTKNSAGLTTIFEQRAVDYCPVHDVKLDQSGDRYYTLLEAAHRPDYQYGCTVCYELDIELDRQHQKKKVIAAYKAKIDVATQIAYKMAEEAVYRAILRLKAEGRM